MQFLVLPTPALAALGLLVLPSLWTLTAADNMDNIFFRTCHLAAQALNESNCWVCAQMPVHQDSGFKIQAVPADISVLLTNGTARHSLPQQHSVLVVQHKASFPICFIWEDHPGAEPVGETVKCNATMTRSASVPPYIASSVDFSAYPVAQPYSADPFYMAACRAWPDMVGQCEDMHPWEAPQDAFWVCGTHAYRVLPASWTGSCALGHVVPALRVTRHRPAGKIRNVRTVRQSMDIVNTYMPLQDWDLGLAAIIPTVGVVRVGWAVQRMQALVDLLSNETAGSLRDLAAEQHELRKLALQNRMALDMILASHGGTCALIGTECCVFVPDYSEEIFDNAKHIASLGAIKEDVSHTWLTEIEGWLGSWWGAVLKYLVLTMATVFVVIIVVKVLVHCITSVCVKPASTAAFMTQVLTDGRQEMDTEMMYMELAGLHTIEIE